MSKLGEEYIKGSKEDKYAYLYKLRRNNILNWTEDLINISKYKKILKECSLASTLTIESGIVKINPIGCYIGHKFVPHVKVGFNFYEIATILKSKIVEFENEYGELSLNDEDIYKLRQIIYKFNRTKSIKLDMADKKQLTHLEQSAEVLYYLLSGGVIFEKQINGWCTLTFSNTDTRKDYCTIFDEDEIELLETINKAIKTDNKK